MKTNNIIKEFDEEFGTKTKDGTKIPIHLDIDVELKERFVIFLIKALKQQRDIRDKEIATLLENTVMNCAGIDESKMSIKILKDIIKILKTPHQDILNKIKTK